MRNKLKDIGSSSRERYKATVGRMGIKSNDFKGFPERTILLKNVVHVDTNEEITDHIWFTVGKTLKELNIKEDDIIIFNARVGKYKKGYYHNEIDYKLNRMTKIEVQRSNRELYEGEITTSTPTSFNELWKAQERARNEKIKF